MTLLRASCLGLALAAMLAAAPGCAVDTRFSQTQLDALQTRQLDVDAERAFLAVVGAMLEQQYHIVESDLEGGVLVATAPSRNSIVQVTVLDTGQEHVAVALPDEIAAILDAGGMERYLALELGVEIS